jgi:GT2 family glycosyltransferase
MTLSVSVVIPHYGSSDLTWACDEALRANTDVPYELIVVDNGTHAELPGTIVRNEKNLGFARACNQGAAAATGDVVVFLNNDTEPCAGWLSPLVAVFADARVGAVGPKLVYADGRPQATRVRIVEDHRGRLRGRAETTHADERGEVRVVCGACVAVRAVAFDEVGAFDEEFWNSNEDLDLCLRLGARGWTIVYEPASVVMHREGASDPAERRRGIPAARDRFTSKWHGVIEPDEYKPRQPATLGQRARRLAQIVRRH